MASTYANGESGGDSGTNGSGGGTGYYSTAVGPCQFTIDSAPPNQPGVTSTAFPPASQGTNQDAGTSGTFTLSSNGDQQPNCQGFTPCTASGVYGFVWSLDQPDFTPSSGNTVRPTSGSYTLTLQPDQWGTNILYVEAIDNAGNVSQPYQYVFDAPWNPSAGAAPGDVNEDQTPDLLATMSGGGLNFYADPTSTSWPSSSGNATTANASPDGGNDWYNYDIAHRGSMTQGNDDDLAAKFRRCAANPVQPISADANCP